MTDERLLALERLLDGFSAYFDIERLPEGDSFVALAKFYSRSEKYVLVKSAKMWAYEGNEYTFVASCAHLDEGAAKALAQEALQRGFALVKPHSEHMYSFVTLLVLCDTMDEAAARILKKTKFHKSFRFSFHGWCDLRIAATSLQNSAIITNGAGKALRKTLATFL